MSLSFAATRSGCGPASTSARTAAPHRYVQPRLAYAVRQQQAHGRTTRLHAAASQVAVAEDLVSTLKKASRTPGSVPPADVVAALVQLEKLKLKPDGWEALLTAPSARWRLVYTVPAKDVTAAAKKEKGGSGAYFPLVAAQKFDDSGFENGVFFGPVASLTFKGPFKSNARNLYFDVVQMSIGLGPWRFSIPLKKEVDLKTIEPKELKKLPFFIYAYVDEDLIVARGRSGGVAMWLKADMEWQAKAGVLQVYK